jgi:hypothetical protein
VIAGHGRLEVAISLGITQVPTICIKDMTEAQIELVVPELVLDELKRNKARIRWETGEVEALIQDGRIGRCQTNNRSVGQQT